MTGPDVCFQCLTYWLIPVLTAAGLRYRCPCGATWTTRRQGGGT